MPIEPKFANPQSANVEIAIERGSSDLSLIMPPSWPNAMNSLRTVRVPSKSADGGAILPRHAQQPSHRREHEPKDALERQRLAHGEQSRDEAEPLVHQGDEREE